MKHFNSRNKWDPILYQQKHKICFLPREPSPSCRKTISKFVPGNWETASNFIRTKKWSKHSQKILQQIISSKCLLCHSLSVGLPSHPKKPQKRSKMYKSQLKLFWKKRSVLRNTPKEINKKSKIINNIYSQNFKNLPPLIKGVMSIEILERREIFRRLSENQKFLPLKTWTLKPTPPNSVRMRGRAII